MSAGASHTWSWRHAITKSQLPPVTRHLLLTLSICMNERGENCFPSITQLQEMTGLSKRSVLTHIDVAVNEGWLRRGNHGLRGQRWRRNEYEAAWPGRDGCAPDEDEEGGAPDAPPCEEKVVHEVHQGGARGAPRHIDQSNTSPDSERERRATDEPARDDSGFRRFLRLWPTAAGDDQQRTWCAWSSLGEADREAALAGVKPFLAHLKAIGRRHVPAGWRYLGERRWTLIPADFRAKKAKPEMEHLPAQSAAWWRLFFDHLEQCRPGQMPTFMAKYLFERRQAGHTLSADRVPDDERVKAMVNVRFGGADWAAWQDWIYERLRKRFPDEDPDKRRFYFVPAVSPPEMQEREAG